MKRIALILACGLIATVIGCSDEQKDEAERLERELLGDTEQVDTTPVDTAQAEAAGEMEAGIGDAEAVPVEEETALPGQPAGSGYVVQVAACESDTYAEHLVSLYETRGYAPFVTTCTLDGQQYYRVRLGIYETLQEAQAVRNELKDDYSVIGWIAETY
jgi:cell division septation protein DedD